MTHTKPLPYCQFLTLICMITHSNVPCSSFTGYTNLYGNDGNVLELLHRYKKYIIWNKVAETKSFDQCNVYGIFENVTLNSRNQTSFLRSDVYWQFSILAFRPISSQKTWYYSWDYKNIPMNTNIYIFIEHASLNLVLWHDISILWKKNWQAKQLSLRRYCITLMKKKTTTLCWWA